MHLVTETLHFEDKHRWLIAAGEWMFGGTNPLVWLQRRVSPLLTKLMLATYSGYFFTCPSWR